MNEVKKYEDLTEKQKRFIDFYIQTSNAAEAARKAGYSAKTARNIGNENLTKLHVFIQERLQKVDEEQIASDKEVLKYLSNVMRGNEKDRFGLDASIQDRTKCAELLGKKYGMFKNSVDVKGQVPVVIEDDITE